MAQMIKHIPLKLGGQIMYYIKVVFNAETWGKLTYGFKVDMVYGYKLNQYIDLIMV